MKKILYIVLLLVGVSACSKEDLTEYFSQLDRLTNSNDSLGRVISSQEQVNNALKAEGEKIQRRLDSLANVSTTPNVTELVAMEFSAAENTQLTADVACEIYKNGTIECWIPYLVDNKELTPRFSFHGSTVTIDGQPAVSGTARYDFKAPVTLSVTGNGETVNYTVFVHAASGLPVMEIDTEDQKEIVSKTEYIRAHMKLTEDVRTRAPGDVLEADLQIRGRGNSTWGLPKKPYRLKFDEKISFFGEHKDRSWVLLANYTDKSMLRNDLALHIGSVSRLDWTPGSHFVDVVLNGRYQGTYELCEKIKISDHRVAVGDDGFILEVEARAARDSTAVYFRVPHIDYTIEVKDPDVEFFDVNYNYIDSFVTEADSVLFSDNFRDSREGWQKYLDIESFVDWYIIHEISKNEDSMFHFSTYMNLKRGGKLKMGPIWDFDIAFGNVKEANTTAMLPEGLMLDWSMWYTRLFQDPVFVSRLKERYRYFYNHKEDFIRYINDDAHYLKYAVQENQNRWGTFYHYTYKQYDIWGSYDNEVQSLKEWLNTRMEWLKSHFDRM